ncbi:OmpP1/FadL family transporter [Alcanivorax sp. DP30]|uniref:OmpP1/FadL family transporter n=1 Tax=Alcanivorax sp. DP30 TaxID=2606217 RepID=UPI0013708DB8|nr:outer membrane protein transport protein [Alcanivorax sp. DP30]MZR63344.1 aromatic hydrocarbon degradation protein [Alcanivorax sp. DP30]
MRIRKLLPAVLAGAGFVSASPVMASMGNIGTTYGVLPSDVASAQALSLFNGQVSATYYNPANLARDSRGVLTSGLMHADHELRASKVSGGSFASPRDGDILQDVPSQQVLLGMKTDLTDLTRYEHPLYLGFMLGVEKYGDEMMAFSSATDRAGQYLEYGRQPLFLNLGGGTQIWRGLDMGLSARITLHSEAELIASSTLGGTTSYESLEVSAVPSIRPIFGMNMDFGESFCGEDACWMNGLEAAFSFRGYSNSSTKVDSTITIPGTVLDPGMSLAVTTIDSYQPNIYAAGLAYARDRWRVGVTLEMQQWSDLESELESDTIKDQAVNASGADQLEFKDIVVPRVGGEFHLNDTYMLTGGLAFSESPMSSDGSLEVNYLDNDKWILGLGLTAEYASVPVLAFPVRFDLAYQYQKLESREFDLYDQRAASYPQPYETVEADGDVHIFSGSITLKF